MLTCVFLVGYINRPTGVFPFGGFIITASTRDAPPAMGVLPPISSLVLRIVAAKGPPITRSEKAGDVTCRSQHQQLETRKTTRPTPQ